MFSHGKVFLGFQFFMMETSVVTGDLLLSPNSNQSFFCNLWKKPIISFCRHVYEGKSICCVLMEVVRDRNSKLEEDGEPPTKSSIHHRCRHHHHHHHQSSSSSIIIIIIIFIMESRQLKVLHSPRSSWLPSLFPP